MRKWKNLFSITLAMSLAISSVAMAEITIPPIPTGNETAADQNNTAGPAGGSNNTPAETGQGNNQGTNQGSSANLTEPIVVAEGAVLMDAATGQVLYGKNQDKQFFPASITKVMTALLVLERCSLNDVVTFSAGATTNLESGSVSLKITEGDQLTVEQALHGLLLKSANEIGNGLAEHVSGSIGGFADLMNARAKELGCKNTNFANPHGLNSSVHKTTPYDMALILRAALQNDNFRRIDMTLTYNFPATKNAGERTITMGHKMMYSTDSRYYSGIIGGKTGYTSLAGNTLVTGVERDGVRLIAVVMKSNGTHYTDTKAMLDYGFENYAALTGRNPNQGNQGSQTGQNTQTGQTSPDGSAAGPGVSTPVQTGWAQDARGWKYRKADGKLASGEWITENDLKYWFDSNEYMVTGWQQFADGSWYYFKAPGYMAKNSWVQDDGDWYYLGNDGRLLTNTTTPDGFTVDRDGIWRG